jgi:heat shock protein HslJ
MNRRGAITTCGFLLAAVLVLSACGSGGGSEDPNALAGVEWSLTASSISSADLGAAGITASFDGTKVAGFSGINQYNGGYTAGKDGSFKVGAVASTQMAGPDALMKSEQAYLKALQQCDKFGIKDGKLILSIGSQETLTYEKAKAVALPGSKWVVTAYNNGKQAVTSLEADSTLSLDFGTDGTASGTSGVNTFSGSFTSTDKTLHIGPLASTQMAGPENLMTQETAYLQALQNSTKWSVVRGMLELRDAQDALQVSANPAK